MLLEVILLLGMNPGPVAQVEDEFPDLPPVWDVLRFPAEWVCREQHVLHSRHLDWLRSQRPWLRAFGCSLSQEVLDDWEQETFRGAFLWRVLEEATDDVGDSAENRRRKLARYQWWVGEERYREGYLPYRFPASWVPLAPLPPPPGTLPSVMPRAAGKGA